jgi:hypothetical protein
MRAAPSPLFLLVKLNACYTYLYVADSPPKSAYGVCCPE